MYVVSLMTPAPSKELQDFIDEVRKPRGKTLMDEKTVSGRFALIARIVETGGGRVISRPFLDRRACPSQVASQTLTRMDCSADGRRLSAFLFTFTAPNYILAALTYTMLGAVRAVAPVRRQAGYR